MLCKWFFFAFTEDKFLANQMRKMILQTSYYVRYLLDIVLETWVFIQLILGNIRTPEIVMSGLSGVAWDR